MNAGQDAPKRSVSAAIPQGAGADDVGLYISPASFEVPAHAPESAWLGHGPFAMWLVRALRPERIVELGTHNGFSYFAFCQAVAEGGLDTQCFAIDHWQGDEHAGFYGQDVFTRVSEHNQRHYAGFSTLMRASFDDALGDFADGSIDLLHIDGRHFYDDVKHDFESWRPKLSARAVVLFHDTDVHERGFGVQRLWAELVQDYPAFEFLHQHGLGVLGYGEDLPPEMAAFFAAVQDPDVAAQVRRSYERLGALLETNRLLGQAREKLAQAAANDLARGKRIEALTRNVSEADAQLAAREAEAGSLRVEIARLIAERDGLAAEAGEAKARIEALSLDLSGMQARLAAGDKRAARLAKERDDARAKLAQKERALAEAAAQARGLRDALDAAAMHKTALEGERAGMAHQLATQAQRTAALEAELAAIRSSRLGRLRAFLHDVRTAPSRLSLWGGRGVVLEPRNQIGAAAGGDPALTEWTFTGNDPHFELGLPARLPPGHYRLRLDVRDGHELLADAHVYVDSGGGYNEAEAQKLFSHAAPGERFCADFSLPRGALRLRFDPTDRPGRLVSGSVRLRRFSRAEFYTRLAFRAFRNHGAAGGSPVKAVRRALEIVRQNGVKDLAARLRGVDRPTGPSDILNYQKWIERFDTLDEAGTRLIRERVRALSAPPLISVVMPVYDTPEALLTGAIDSVRAQIYENWELCVADDRSTKPHIRTVLERYAAADPRIKVVFREENGHIAHATNSAFALASGEWVALLDHDDLLRPHALAEVALEIGRHRDAQLIYSDEDKIGPDGRRYDPYFKPEFSPELFRSQNYFNHLTVHRAENIRDVGGWRPGFEGSQDYDLNLRIVERVDPSTIRHIPKVLYHWRAVAGSTAVDGSEKTYAYSAGLRALEEHVERLGLPASVGGAPDTPFYRLRFSIPEPKPLVSLIVPTRDRVELLRGCVESIRDKTEYGNYEIVVVDNGSRESETLAYFAELAKAPNIRVLEYDRPFNYSAINNFAVGQAGGDIVGLVNNDIEVISPDWLDEMVSWAVQPDIGCVGAKLYYANDTIQHAGVILGLGGVAGHSHKHFPRDHPGYFFRLKVVQNLSAVTAACLLVRRSVYEEVGGLNEDDLTVAFNDVDFCLKVGKAGYRNVWTPYAELYHLESISRGAEDDPQKIARFQGEKNYMKATWRDEIHNDPYYSPNLTRNREDFSLG